MARRRTSVLKPAKRASMGAPCTGRVSSGVNSHLSICASVIRLSPSTVNVPGSSGNGPSSSKNLEGTDSTLRGPILTPRTCRSSIIWRTSLSRIPNRSPMSGTVSHSPTSFSRSSSAGGSGLLSLATAQDSHCLDTGQITSPDEPGRRRLTEPAGCSSARLVRRVFRVPYTRHVSSLGPFSLIDQVVDGRYRVLSHLADGGMATVYIALDQRLDRQVALKVMRADLAKDESFVERFRREARSAAKLSHPNVVAVFDQGEDDGHVFLAMELVNGLTLRQVMHSEGPLTARAALDIIDPVLQALGAAHSAGLIHRDVKPENVILRDDGTVKVADFGLARAIATTTSTAQTGVLLGTVAYLSPEQVERGAPGQPDFGLARAIATTTSTAQTGVLLGTVAYLSPEQVERGIADARSDVYAAGLLLFEMLTGSKASQ